MGWRDKYKVHPAADVFPMMSDDELKALGEDIKANGQTIPVLFWNGDGKGAILIDGRNRLEARERIGMADQALTETFICKDPATHIITLNIHRRHLTKQQQADLIVAVHKAAADPSPSWRGVTSDPVKTAAVATAKEHGISKRTVERAIAKAEGKTPKPKPKKPIEYSEPFAVNTACGQPTGITAMRVPVALLDGTRKRVVTEDGIVLESVDDDGGDDCTIERKQWIGGVEAVWDAASTEVKQHLVRHICKEADPVSLALSLVEMMDAQQVRRLLVGVEEYQSQLARKKK
jgi:hypothetical protein